MELPARIEADPLVVRSYTEADAPALVVAISENVEHLRPWMPWIEHEPMSLGDRVELIRQWEHDRRAGTNVNYGIFLDGEIVGGTGYHPRIGPHGLEIGYWVHREHLGRGIATTASRSLIDHAFTIEGIDRVEIHHDVANERSERVPMRLGMLHVDDVARPPQAPGDAGIMRIWRVTKDEWLD